MSTINLYLSLLDSKYEKVIQNKWVWVVVAFVAVIGFFAYAFYCTSRGYSFSGHVRLHWPKVWQMGIGCKK